ncbi:MAG: hypothetical protein RBS37_10290 [Bacteroidales bacterium]|nr:hypothetical protein [Bacteroidales bacterium]
MNSGSSKPVNPNPTNPLRESVAIAREYLQTSPAGGGEEDGGGATVYGYQTPNGVMKPPPSNPRRGSISIATGTTTTPIPVGDQYQ